jgi:hypothetical protein
VLDVDEYSKRFEIVQLESITNIPPTKSLAHGSAQVHLDISATKFPTFSPYRIIDATGSGSHFMNKVLQVPYSTRAYNHGPALVLSWPGHKVDSKSKHIILHDCHGKTPCFPDGFSNDGSFANPSDAIDKHMEAWGFATNPEIVKENTPYNDHLGALFQDLDNPSVSKHDKSVISEFFVMIKNAGPTGLSGLEAVKQLEKAESVGASRLAVFLGSKVIPSTPPIVRYDSNFIKTWEANLELMRVKFLPSRIERHLTQIKVDNIPLKLSVAGQVVAEKKVHALAIGDSLATTDFLASSGTNRAFSTARQIFALDKEPERVFKELVQETFPVSGRENYAKVKADATRCLLVASKSRKRLRLP